MCSRKSPQLSTMHSYLESLVTTRLGRDNRKIWLMLLLERTLFKTTGLEIRKRERKIFNVCSTYAYVYGTYEYVSTARMQRDRWLRLHAVRSMHKTYINCDSTVYSSTVHPVYKKLDDDNTTRQSKRGLSAAFIARPNTIAALHVWEKQIDPCTYYVKKPCGKPRSDFE